MKYSYKVHQEGKEIYIQEFLGEDIRFEWHIDKFKKDVIINKKKWKRSFLRTKKWIKDHHPEVLL